MLKNIDFKQWLDTHNQTFPVPEELFDETIEKYSVTEHLISMKLLGFIDRKLMFFRIKYNLVGVVDPSPGETQQIFQDSAALLGEFNAKND